MSNLAHQSVADSTQPKLENLNPLNLLSPDHLRQIADSAKVDRLPVNGKLVRRDEHRWMVYLLQGKLTLVPRAGNKNELSSNTAPANSPVFDHACKPELAVATSPSLVIRVDRGFSAYNIDM